MDALIKEIEILKKGAQLSQIKLSQVTKELDGLYPKEDTVFQCEKCDHSAMLETNKQEQIKLTTQGNSKAAQTDQPENGSKELKGVEPNKVKVVNSIEPKEVSSPESKQELKCPKCQYIAKSKGMLTIHIDVQHSSFPVKYEPEVQCKTCNFQTKTVGQLMAHMKTDHNKTLV